MRNTDSLLKERAEKTAKALVRKLKTRSLTLSLAESCTAGLASALIAGESGASSVLWGSFACYTRKAKVSMLGIDDEALARGLVSRETAEAMATGALQKSGAQIAASVTGLAGPDGDGSPVHVGTVWVSAALKDGEISTEEFHFTGPRNEVRLKAAIAVMDAVDKILEK